jgi:hypothetical protein
MSHVRVDVTDGDPEDDGVGVLLSRPLEALDLDVIRTVPEAAGDVAISVGGEDTHVEIHLEEADAQALAEALGDQLAPPTRSFPLGGDE